MVTEVVPSIYSPRFRTPHVSLWGRLLAAGVAAGCLAVLIVASQLQPSTTGMGTHTDIGLQPCQFLSVTDIPCMGCGMTTSFTHFAHGNLPASLWVQPAGTFLAVLCAVAVWAAGYIAVTGRAAHRVLRFIPGLTLIWIGAAVIILGWVWKIYIYKSGMDGW